MKKSIFFLCLITVLCACKSNSNMSSFDFLTKNTWVLSEMNNTGIPDGMYSGESPFMKFSDSGGLSGFSGCNNFNGNYSLTDNGITLDPGAMTRKMCPGDGEQKFMEAISIINDFEVDAEHLVLSGDNNTRLSFIPK